MNFNHLKEGDVYAFFKDAIKRIISNECLRKSIGSMYIVDYNLSRTPPATEFFVPLYVASENDLNHWFLGYYLRYLTNLLEGYSFVDIAFRQAKNKVVSLRVIADSSPGVEEQDEPFPVITIYDSLKINNDDAITIITNFQKLLNQFKKKYPFQKNDPPWILNFQELIYDKFLPLLQPTSCEGININKSFSKVDPKKQEFYELRDWEKMRKIALCFFPKFNISTERGLLDKLPNALSLISRPVYFEETHEGHIREMTSGGVVIFWRLEEMERETLVKTLTEFEEALWLKETYPCIVAKSIFDLQTRVMREATRTSCVSLYSRNLSHNLGSHILHWLEQEVHKEANELKNIGNNSEDTNLKANFMRLARYFEAKELFYRYLRERMDLIAAAAVYLPTWTTTVTMKELVAGLDPSEVEKDSLVLRHIGHSEGVCFTDIVIPNTDYEIALPGSIMGKQAFYGILENIARDAAKYGDLKANVILIVKKTANSGQWNCLGTTSSIEVYHLDVSPENGFEVEKLLTRKLSSFPNKRILTVLVFDGPQNDVCSASRDIRLENEIQNSNVIIWNVSITSNCHHELCRLVRELTHQLESTEKNNDKICKKEAELDRALLSIAVEVSELDNNDLKNIEEKRQQEVKDNMLRAIVYDDRSSFTEDINKAIEKVEKEGLCDQYGRLRPMEWGLKERYIFATYLRGETPEEWLMPEALRHEKSASPPILRVREGRNHRMEWVFYLLKPKDILIVSDNHNQQEVPVERRDKVNVWSWSTLKQRLKSSLLRHNFIVLCLTEEKEIENLERYLDYLPYRIFIFNPNKLKTSEYIKQHCAFLPQKDFDLRELSMELLYPQWIKFIAERQKRNEPKIVEGVRGKYYVDQNGNMTLASNFNLQQEKDVVLFDRHGMNGKAVKEKLWKESKVIHYEPFEEGWSVCFRADFAQNRELRKKYPRLKYLLQEAALIRILILDERIDTSLDDMQFRFGSVELKGRRLWGFKGIDVMGKEYKGRRSEIPDKKSLLDHLRKAANNGRPYDFILIHQGILDKLYELQKTQDGRVQYMKKLLYEIREKGNIWHVLVHSGRGGIPQLPERVKFIHLSSLEAWFGSNLSKADVIGELMSVRRETNEIPYYGM
jgi:hypothetical protein